MLSYYVKLFILTLLAFFAIDMVWLGLIARTFYRQQIGFLMASPPNWLAAIIFYLLFVAGILVFVVLPGSQSGELKSTLLHAAFFGLVTYATYDLTNLATLKDWPVKLVLVDLAWGVVLSTLISYISIQIAGKLS